MNNGALIRRCVISKYTYWRTCNSLSVLPVPWPASIRDRFAEERNEACRSPESVPRVRDRIHTYTPYVLLLCSVFSRFFLFLSSSCYPFAPFHSLRVHYANESGSQSARRHRSRRVHSSLFLSLLSLPFRFFVALFSRLILPLSTFLLLFFQATYLRTAEFYPAILASTFVASLPPRRRVPPSPPPCVKDRIDVATATDRKIRASQISVTDRSAVERCSNSELLLLLLLLLLLRRRRRRRRRRSSGEVCERCREM